MTDDQQRSFSSMYRDFEDVFRGSPELIRRRLSVYLPLLGQVETASSPDERRILDLGAGRGEWLRLLRARGWQATGIDSNSSMVQAAREAGIEVIEDDMSAFLRNAEDESFDVISAFHVVEHIPVDALIDLLNELTRVLKPGGLVILETPNPENLSVASWSFRMDPTHRQPLPPALLQFLSASAGLRGAKVLRLNGSGRSGGNSLVAAIDAAFRTAPDYAVLATKAASPLGLRMSERITAFVSEYSEPSPQVEMLEGLRRIDTELAERDRQVSMIEPAVERLAAVDSTAEDALARARAAESKVEALGDVLAHAMTVERKVEALAAETSGLRERLAALTNRPGSVTDGARWLIRGARAWATFRPGSRPHRAARRAIIHVYGDDDRQGPGIRIARTAFSLFPEAERRARLIARRAGRGSDRAILAEPPGSPAYREPESVQVAFARLKAAAAACGDTPGHEQGARPRLAFVSPLPPARTGVADYSANLLPALAGHYDITVIVEQSEYETTFGGTRFEVADIQWFKRHAARFDRILYHFGNSTFHAHMIELIRCHPGVVAMHDALTGDLFAHLEWQAGWDHFWSRELLESHGYEAVKHRFEVRDPVQTIVNFPANLRVLRDAQGVVVHSDFARSLFERRFSPAFGRSCRVVPLARALSPVLDREAARAALGLSPDLFIACTMGSVGPSKCTDRVVDAWGAAGLAGDAGSRLVIVGNAPASDYADALFRRIKAIGGHGITVTGYVTAEQYETYLAAADCVIQLRNQSRGETSGALLDCLAAGRAVILNAHGSMAETPAGTAIVLPEIFETSALSGALLKLRYDPALRERFGEQARLLVAEKHRPAIVAEHYRSVLEEFARAAPPVYSAPHLAELASGIGGSASGAALLDLARSLAPAHAARRPVRRLLVDVSAIARSDLRTGIQRVVRSQLVGLIENPPAGFRIEPVALWNREGRWNYEYARDYAAKAHGLPEGLFPIETVDVAAGDILFVADFWGDGLVAAAKAGIYREWRDRGVSINIAVYDILPLTMPEYFPASSEASHREWLENAVAVAHRLICISDATADDVRRWISKHLPASRSPAIVGIPLGADLQASLPTSGLPLNAREILARMRARRTFIMVGTVEPRKGHLQAIAAFEELWSRGHEEQLLIVGGDGWRGVPLDQKRTIPEILRTLRGSREFGRRLIWIDNSSDAFLDELYLASACLLAPSEGEGFGLPLVEAARHGLPVLARDLPVFREVAGPHAFYFSGLQATELAGAIEAWLELDRTGSAPRSNDMDWLTWAGNVERLTEVLVGDA